jgi:hypothetical protein
MKRPHVRLGVFLSLAPFLLTTCLIGAQTAPDNRADAIVVADGTPVHLVLMDDLQGKKLRVNQTVHFEVREDLIVQSRVIVKTGSEAIGHIASVSRKGLLGRSGKLVLQFDYVESTAGVRISLRGGARVSGGRGGALTWESAMWYGPDANLPVGTVINAFVDKDQRISVH